MGDKSKIEWTDATWNVVTGCARVSEGCRNCYAERLAATRLAHVPAYEGLAEMTPAGPRWTGAVRFNIERLALPLRWAKPRMVFVNSQSDLFHEGLTNEQIAAIFGVMAASPQHIFQILTKRPERAVAWFKWLEKSAETAKRDVFRSDGLDWTRQHVLRAPALRFGMEFPRGRSHIGMDAPWPLPNVWLGVSCEDQATADDRIPLLLQCPAAVRWLSAEPLLGPIDLSRWVMSAKARKSRRDVAYWKFSRQANAKPPSMADPEAYGPGLDWVVAGGESGPGARPCHPDWVRSIRDQCTAAGVAYFFKQWGEAAPFDALAPDLQRKLRAPSILTDAEFVPATLYNVGKGKAGRLLDGRTWDEMPEVCHA